MFYAYSPSKEKIVHISTEKSLTEIYKCPNPSCTAEFHVKGKDSSVVDTHFARISKNSVHIPNCPYEISSIDYSKFGHIDKHTIDDIFNNVRQNTESTINSPKPYNGISKVKSTNIHTPKQLLQFCISNKTTTEFRDDLTINDIFVDSRNLTSSKYYLGVQGLRLILGETIRFDKDKKTIYFDVKSHVTTLHTLHAKVHCSFAINSIIDCFLHAAPEDKFKNKPIAVFAEWQIDKQYNISTSIDKEKLILYKFS